MILSLGLYVQFSMAGLPNFGHVAFMAVAAYTMAILVVRLEMGLPLASVLALLAAVILGLVLGVPALRLRADYLAIATVAGGEMVRYLAMNFPGLTGGPLGLDRPPRAGRHRHVQRRLDADAEPRWRRGRRTSWDGRSRATSS